MQVTITQNTRSPLWNNKILYYVCKENYKDCRSRGSGEA